MDDYDGSFHTYDEEDFDPGSGRAARRQRKGKSRRRDRQAREGGGDGGRGDAGGGSHDALSGLAVMGRPCRILRDDALAGEIDAGNHLVDLFDDAMGIGGGGGGSFDGDDYGGLGEHGRDSDVENEDEDDGCHFVDPPEDDSTKRRRRSGRLDRPATKLLVDRHDARSLLDPSELEPPTAGASAVARTREGNSIAYEEEEADSELNFERYGALPEYRTIFLGEDDASGEKMPSQPKADRNGRKTATGHAESGEGADAKNQDESFQLDEAERRALPAGMVTGWSAFGLQFEVMLKVRQASNDQFAFLSPGHELHPYYLFLRENGGEIPLTQEPESNDSSSDDNKKQKEGGALGGLLGMYSSSEDEDGDGDGDRDEDADSGGRGPDGGEEENLASEGSAAGRSALKEEGGSSSNDSRAGKGAGDVLAAATSLTTSTADDELRARRLKRARLMKGHFAHKMKGDSGPEQE